MKLSYRIAFCLALLASLISYMQMVRACPFCSAVQQTLSEEIKGADAALIVKLNMPPKRVESGDKILGDKALNVEPAKAAFEVVQVLKGENLLAGKKQIEVLYFGNHPMGTQFFVTGVDPKEPAWSTPTALSPRAAEYLAKIVKLPESGAERLVFFQQFFEDKDPLLAGDAYDEFAKAPYTDVNALKAQMDREKLLGWINDPQTSTSRRRLYLTMLGVCGQKDDIARLETMIRDENRQLRTSLDALVACYLNLTGPSGLPLVEDLFLKNAKAEYVDTYATIMALRFHGQEASVIPRDKLLGALRHMLDRPNLADLVIPDLARWEDWTVMEKLVDLFKNAKEDSIWVRVPVINYLRACPKPEAKVAIDELAKVDPDSVKRANQFFPFSAKPPASAVRPEDKQKPSDKATEKPSIPVPAATSGKQVSFKPSDTLPSDGDQLQDDTLQDNAIASADSATVLPTASAVPVTVVSLPKTLTRGMLSLDEGAESAVPASRWQLLTFAGVSALMLTVFMFTLFYQPRG